MSEKSITLGIIKLSVISFVLIVILSFLAISVLRVRSLLSPEWSFLTGIIPQFLLAIVCIGVIATFYRLYYPYLSRLLARSNLRWLMAILSLGLILRLAYVTLIPTIPVSDFRTYHDLAVNMLQYGVYGFGTTPDSYRPPGESFFLYIIYMLSGSTDFIYPKLAQVAMGTLNIAFVYIIAKKTFDDKAAIIASLLMAILPTQIFYTSIIASENTFTFLNLLALALLASIDKGQRLYYPSLFVTGVLLGCAVLVRPVSVLLPALILVIILIRDYNQVIKDKNELKKIAVVTLIFTIAVAIIIVPWCMRNYMTFDHFSISSNGGMAFWVGNNEHATGQYNYAIEPIINDTFGDIHNLNDFQKEDLYYSDSIQYILSHPIETLKLDIKKLCILYGSSTLGIYWSMLADGAIADPNLQKSLNLLNPLIATLSNGYYYFILLLALLGLPILVSEMIRNKNYLALILVAYVLYFSLIFSISLADDRYNFNVLPILAILAAYAISKALWPDKPLGRE